MRRILTLGALVVLTACGGGRGATGDISNACLDADRKAASRALCSCVQQVANQTLSARDQARAASFFANPQLAQDTRQSDNRASEAFWQRYKAFSSRARQQCRSLT